MNYNYTLSEHNLDLTHVLLVLSFYFGKLQNMFGQDKLQLYNPDSINQQNICIQNYKRQVWTDNDCKLQYFQQ